MTVATYAPNPPLTGPRFFLCASAALLLDRDQSPGEKRLTTSTIRHMPRSCIAAERSSRSCIVPKCEFSSAGQYTAHHALLNSSWTQRGEDAKTGAREGSLGNIRYMSDAQYPVLISHML